VYFRESTFWVLEDLVPLGTTTVRPGYQVKELFLNVYTIKDKPRILYFNLFLIVNIMNNYFTLFVRVNGHFMTLKHL